MPSIAHLVLGAVVGISLFYISDGKFSKTHAFILMLNNYFGPDVGYVVGLGDYTHSYLFWPLFAVVLTFFYHYFTKFTIKLDSIKEIELIELEDYKLTFLNTYFVVLAGGFMHCYLDGMMNWKGVFMLSPEIGGTPALHPTLDDVFHLWWDGLLDVNPILAFSIGVMFIFGFVFVIVWFLKKNTFGAGIVVIIYLIAFMVFFALAGNMTTMIHPDGGAVVYVSLFWALPFIFIVLSTKEFKFLKRDKEKVDKKERKPHINFWTFIYLLISVFIGFIGFLLLSSNFIDDSSVPYDTAIWPDLNPTYTTLFLNSSLPLSIVFLGIGSLTIVIWSKYLNNKENLNKTLLLTSISFLIAGFALVSISILGFFMNSEIIPDLYSMFEDQISSYLSLQEVISLAFIVEIVLLILGIVYLVCSFGLILKNRVIWRGSIYFSLVFAWTLIGLIFACKLSEDSVKETMVRREI